MKPVVILECPACGAWKDAPFATARFRGEMPGWTCPGCRRSSFAADDRQVRVLAIGNPIDGRLYELLLQGAACTTGIGGYRFAKLDVRPFLEPLLD